MQEERKRGRGGEEKECFSHILTVTFATLLPLLSPVLLRSSPHCFNQPLDRLFLPARNTSMREVKKAWKREMYTQEKKKEKKKSPSQSHCTHPSHPTPPFFHLAVAVNVTGNLEGPV